MANWHCSKCKEEMKEEELTVIYLEIDAPIQGIKCPKCGVSYITEEVAIGALAQGELQIEQK